MTLQDLNLATDWPALAHRQNQSSLTEALEGRTVVEAHFAALGHTYRHGRLYRSFEHRVTRPLLRSMLQLSGLYARGLRNAQSPILRKLSMAFDDLPTPLEGFTLLHLSDFHIEGVPGLAEALISVLRDLRPDICVLTGDYRFEDHGPCEAVYPLMQQVLNSIHTRLGVYGILGNHDCSEIAYRLEKMGVRMLINEAVEIQ